MPTQRAMIVMPHLCDHHIHLLTLGQESDYSAITKSNPYCWELLAILTKEPTDLTVHGRYVTLSQMELRPWLPEDVMTEMLDRFTFACKNHHYDGKAECKDIHWAATPERGILLSWQPLQ